LEELQEYDLRPTFEEFKRRSQEDPKLGLAFRRLLDANVSPEEIVKLADKTDKQKKK